MRICITGGPRTGKTTLADEMTPRLPIAEHIAAGGCAIHCDDFISMGWSESSAHVATLIDRPGPWLAEGVQVPRALRKFIEAHPGVKPCDRLVILRNAPHEPWTPGQARMAKGIDTVLAEILPELRRLGVEIEERL